MKLGYLFSGQGSQFAQMGQDLYQQEPAYQKTVDKASSVLGLDLANSAVFDDPDNVQVAILTMSVGINNILQADGFTASMATGLSLGEYSALVANQMLEFDEALQLVADRTRYMAQAGEQNPGKMAAVLRADYATVAAVVADFTDVVIANYNADDQLVIGGNPEQMDQAIGALKAAGVKKVMPLKVAVASHTPLMQPAQVQLAQRLQAVTVNPAQFAVISNTTKQPFTQATLKSTLADQLVQPTHFKDCVQIVGDQVDLLVELGPGKTLTKLATKNVKDTPAYHVDSVATLNELRTQLEEINNG